MKSNARSIGRQNKSRVAELALKWSEKIEKYN